MISASRRRKRIPDRTKLIATLRHFGLSISEIHFDHHPALALRDWDEAAKDTIPPANCPEHIQLMLVEDHRTKTSGTKATSAGSDIHKIAKLRRLTKKQAEFRSRLLSKESGTDAPVSKPKAKKIKSRGFSKQQRKMQSRKRMTK